MLAAAETYKFPCKYKFSYLDDNTPYRNRDWIIRFSTDIFEWCQRTNEHHT